MKSIKMYTNLAIFLVHGRPILNSILTIIEPAWVLNIIHPVHSFGSLGRQLLLPYVKVHTHTCSLDRYWSKKNVTNWWRSTWWMYVPNVCERNFIEIKVPNSALYFRDSNTHNSFIKIVHVTTINKPFTLKFV